MPDIVGTYFLLEALRRDPCCSVYTENPVGTVAGVVGRRPNVPGRRSGGAGCGTLPNARSEAVGSRPNSIGRGRPIAVRPFKPEECRLSAQINESRLGTGASCPGLPAHRRTEGPHCSPARN